MNYLVILDHDRDRYTATVPALPDCRVEGSTREAALHAAREAILERLSRSEIVTVVAPPETSDNPWENDAGCLANHPGWDRFQEAIRHGRAETADSAS